MGHLLDVFQIPQQVSVAQTEVAAIIFEIRRPVVVHQNRFFFEPRHSISAMAAARNNVNRIDRFGTAFSMALFHCDVA